MNQNLGSYRPESEKQKRKCENHLQVKLLISGNPESSRVEVSGVSGEEQRRNKPRVTSCSDIHKPVPMSIIKRISFFKAPPDPCGDHQEIHW
ncbi:hypothetical protein Q7C36_021395 [Tachysurus vachellii]|uniref:Uncharacterized protein n=1 Tax=Tachysurus vachellii TaxID=175792 RepID=A0AA88ITP8_TACVA|nr:hypothetical protein Q7C36_021395 [Tachysurus vachellii]